MNYHEQEEITVNHPGYGPISFNVDKEIKDIIINCFHWKFPTVLSCQGGNNENVWIAFESFYDVKEMMQLILTHNISINGQGYVRETLFDYIVENVEFNVSFIDETIYDPNNEDTVIPTGRIEYDIGMRFPSEELEHFRKLFYEVFPLK